jgi:N-acetylglucosamine kinase-like BadF-type ATPase
MDVPDDQELKRAFGGFDLPDRKQLTLVGDAVTAAFGATKGAPGVLIISGTGSIAVSIVSQDGYDFSGGLGPLIGGDPGSAFWMAAEAVQLAFRNQAATGTLCAIGVKVVEYFEISRLSLIIPILYNRDFNSGRLAGLSCFLGNELSVDDSPDWHEIQKAAGERLAEMAVTLLRNGKSAEVPVFGAGSVIRKNSIVCASLAETLSDLLERNIVIQKPQMDAPSGAALLALQKAGITIGDETFQELGIT